MIRVRKRHANAHGSFVLEVLVGLYSDEAYNALRECFRELYTSRFTQDRIDGYVTRAEDGEIALLAEWSVFARPYMSFWPDAGVCNKQQELDKIPGCRKEGCGILCPHFWECSRSYWEENLKDGAMRYLMDHGSALADKELDIYYRMLNEWNGIPKNDNSAIVGKPLDPFRLESIKTMKEEITRLEDDYETKRSLREDTRREEGALDSLLAEYHKLLGCKDAQ